MRSLFFFFPTLIILETPFNQYMDKCAWHVKEETNKLDYDTIHVKSVQSLDYQVERRNQYTNQYQV